MIQTLRKKRRVTQFFFLKMYSLSLSLSLSWISKKYVNRVNVIYYSAKNRIYMMYAHSDCIYDTNSIRTTQKFPYLWKCTQTLSLSLSLSLCDVDCIGSTVSVQTAGIQDGEFPFQCRRVSLLSEQNEVRLMSFTNIYIYM